MFLSILECPVSSMPILKFFTILVFFFLWKPWISSTTPWLMGWSFWEGQFSLEFWLHPCLKIHVQSPDQPRAVHSHNGFGFQVVGLWAFLLITIYNLELASLLLCICSPFPRKYHEIWGFKFISYWLLKVL